MPGQDVDPAGTSRTADLDFRLGAPSCPPKVPDDIRDADGMNAIALTAPVDEERRGQANREPSTHHLRNSLEVIEVGARVESPLEARHQRLGHRGAVA